MSLKRNFYVLLAIVGLVGWRGMWLTAAVPDTTACGDVAAELATKQLDRQGLHAGIHPEKWRVSFAAWETNPSLAASPFRLEPRGRDLWDESLPVWITPGQDGQPGWAGWDDNGDGVIDDEGELGAAWSDDFCVVQLPGEPPPLGRILDRGAFRPITHRVPDQERASGQEPPPSGIIRQRFDVLERLR